MVFGNIIGDSMKPHAYDKFLNTDMLLSIQESDQLNSIKQHYLLNVKSIEDVLVELSQIEELIIQLRCREMIQSEMKFAISREYIYARSIFYRKKNDIKDIRIIAGKTTDLGDDMNELYKNQNLVDSAIKKLHVAMSNEIEKTLQKFNYIYQNV